MKKNLLKGLLKGLLSVGIAACLLCNTISVNAGDVLETDSVTLSEDTMNKNENEDNDLEEAVSDNNAETDFSLELLTVSDNRVKPVYDIPDNTATYNKDFEYQDNIVFSGVYGSNILYFEIPDYWECQYAYAQLEMSLSNLINEDPASLSFMVNGVPVASYSISYEDGKKQIFSVSIPLEQLKEGFNTFEITGYVRIYDEEGCLDDMTGANWVCISEDSFLRVGYEVKQENIVVSDFPYPFMSTIDENGAGLTIAVSDKQESGELTAALSLRAYVANETGDQDEITVSKQTVNTGDERNILISMYENLSEDLKKAVDKQMAEDEISLSELDSSAIILLTDNNYKTAKMVITSNNADCLNEAVALLEDENRVFQENKIVAYAKSGGIMTMQEAFAYTDMQADSYTLDSLVESGLTYFGPFHQEADIYLPFSGGFVLAETAKVDLKFRYSENLDFDRSLITVYWGSIPVASKKLKLENAGGDYLSFTMPDDVIGTYAGKITIAFELEIKDLFCAPRMEDMPWAYVTEDSVFYLPVGSSSDFRLEDRPFPFELESKFNDLVVAIPDELTETELQTLGRVVTCYGADIEPYGDLKVVRASEISESDKQSNLIVFGTYNNNKLLKELNSSLTFSFADTGERFVSNKIIILSEDYGSSIGTLQLYQSPYNTLKAVLAVCGPSDKEIGYIGSFLTETKNLWKLSGDTALISQDQDIKTYDLVERLNVTEEPTLKSVVEANKPAVIFTIVATAVIALMLIAMLLILIRIYKLRDKRTK